MLIPLMYHFFTVHIIQCTSASSFILTYSKMNPSIHPSIQVIRRPQQFPSRPSLKKRSATPPVLTTYHPEAQ
ncbi:uncharacterized protein EI90DRAFT_3084524 [Cantharellus anzutake]|uniref:uncharacterized protein n=1 Tax=Cantharellus anzutake TaxID=1750568 RepID=UPI0019073D42|nr:uncharacterized protein EI90DRAFT_3084524 [Cantharellus anzutake]KAF8318049.1 hypothetical protein EI90DRAFT_3084524 [Cantharellus anzutake]